MKAKNQIVIISGIFALLATIAAASYAAQPAKANFGEIASGQAQSGVQNQHSADNAQGQGSGIGNGLCANSGGPGCSPHCTASSNCNFGTDRVACAAGGKGCAN